MSGPQSGDLCYLCAKQGADSEEHVVARCFFGGTATAHLTLRAHKACNNRFSVAEEYVRNTLATLDAGKGDACEAARAKTRDALLPERPNSYTRRKLEQQRRETVRQDNGQFLWDALAVDRGLWDKACWKLTRGLGFWATGLLCPRAEDPPWGTGPMKLYHPLERPSFSVSIGEGFSAEAEWTHNGTSLVQGDVRLTFYQGVTIRVVFGAPFTPAVA